ncbi:MAG TPA: HAMP domain-containing sensor histidine kinase [Gemmatimonadales bacterium]|nr:HAMP domain-containing sensor histidine kinase [Gemmatimonadales bacterium]
MATIRRRLTIWYTVALSATVLAFGVALYLERRGSILAELDERVHVEAQFVVQYLARSYTVLGQITREGPPPFLGDTLDSRPGRAEVHSLEPSVGAPLDGLRGFLIVADRNGHQLYTSDPARELSFAILDELLAQVRTVPDSVLLGTLHTHEALGSLRYVILPVREAGPLVGAVLVALPLSDISFGPAELLRSMFLVGPLILLGALVLGYWLAGRRLRPLDRMIDEVEAITDGTSLHRRLAVPMTGDELSRLALTVNRMIARLERSFTSLRRFTADASHELKTPLMVVRAGVERALTRPEIPPESLETLDQALEQTNFMAELVDNLLTLARVDEGRAPLVLEECDVRDVVLDVYETAGILGESAGVDVATHMPDQPVLIQADRGRIRQMLLNLLTNAIKYTPQDGRIDIELEDLDTQVVFVVRDTGIGIAAGDLEHIFDRFWRADVARSRAGGRPGVGLGLAITKWIAEAHGGWIEAESRPGRGTTFRVTIPRSAGVIQPAGERDVAPPLV